jgi:cytochrome c553
MKKIIFLMLIFSFLGCNQKEKTSNCSKPEKKLKMYQMSEMALLMEQMNVENVRLKQKINNHEPLGEYPIFFDKILTSKFTDASDNDVFFKEKAALFIASQKLIYENPVKAKEYFNAAVASCIICHEKKCGGPIVKIKKLYIK